MILAQAAGYSFVHIIIVCIVVAACVGIALVAFRQFGIVIPQFVVYIFWIVLCAVLAIFAIRFVAGL